MFPNQNRMNNNFYMNPMQMTQKMPEKLEELIHMSIFESMSEFSNSLSLKCMEHCHEEIISDEHRELSTESIRALEKQCSLSCFRKYSNARDLYLSSLNNSQV